MTTALKDYEARRQVRLERARVAAELRAGVVKGVRQRFTNPPKVLPGLTTSDVVIYPDYFDGDSRKSLDVKPWDGPGSMGIVSANMTPTTGRRMVRSLALRGGLGILPQDRQFGEILDIVRETKMADTWCERAITARPDDKVMTIRHAINKLAALMVVVVDENNCPIGIVTPECFSTFDLNYRIADVMRTRKLTFVHHGTPLEDAYQILTDANVHFAPVIDGSGALVGVIGRNDILCRSFLPPSLDAQGRLAVGAAVGIGGDCSEKVQELLDVGCDFVVVDTAHADQKQAHERVAEAAQVIAAHGYDARLVVGNVSTPEAVHRLLEEIAKGGLSHDRTTIKVGQGPGSMCTTRIKAGSGRPQFSATLDCSWVAKQAGAAVWADGAVRYGRDICLYTAAGASRCMLGSLTTQTVESAAELISFDGNKWAKEYRGSASRASNGDRQRDNRLSGLQMQRALAFVEGVDGVRRVIDPKHDTVANLMIVFQAALRSGISYSGSHSAREMAEFAKIEIQNASAMGESIPHGAV